MKHKGTGPSAGNYSGNDYDRGRASDEKFSFKIVHSIESDIMDRYVACIHPENGQNILDLCSGYGDVSKHLLKNMKERGINANLVLLDNSERQISRAQREIGEHPSVAFCHGNALDIPYPDNHFDTIVLKMALHDVNSDDQEKMLTEAHRVLKPGGKIVVWDLALNEQTKGPFTKIIRIKNDLSGFKYLVANRTFNTEREMHDRLCGAGFEEMHVEHRFHPVLSLNSRADEMTACHHTELVKEKGELNCADRDMLEREGLEKVDMLKRATQRILRRPEDKRAFNYRKTPDGDITLTPEKYIVVAHKTESHTR